MVLVLGLMPWGQVWLWSDSVFSMYFRGITWSLVGIVAAVHTLKRDKRLSSQIAALVGMFFASTPR